MLEYFIVAGAGADFLEVLVWRKLSTGRLHKMMLVRGDDDILNCLAIPISISRGASVW